MSAQTLLIEIVTEELPPKSLAKLSQVFADTIVSELIAANFCSAKTTVMRYATPRRLGVKVAAVLATQPECLVEKKGPAVTVAYDANGEPTKALIGFAKAAGVQIADLQKVKDGNREVLLAKSIKKGQALAELLPAMLDNAFKALPVAKNMRWGDLAESFVRPVHRITLLLGSQVLPYCRFGINADRITDGHRFLGKQAISIANADQYERLIASEGAVIADFAQRREIILQQLDTALKTSKHAKVGDSWLANTALVDEVTALTENPTVIIGTFDAEFLQVPQEALILAMTQHQKYFPVINANGKITTSFLLVANMPPSVSAPNTIRQGNERVLRARLSDAQFFYETDCKVKLSSRVKGFVNVVHLQSLSIDRAGIKTGASLADRVWRISELAKIIAETLKLEVNTAVRAAELCKTDLLSDLVGEFPELQGIAGKYYAKHDGETDELAIAIGEHYQPRFSGDLLAQSKLGVVLALADKLEAIAAMFGINQAPTGDKDPFGVRRAALGVIRMLVELKLPLDLADINTKLPKVFANTAWQSCHKHGNTLTLMQSFMYDRLRQYLRDKNHEVSLINAVLAKSPTRFDEVLEKLLALAEFIKKPEAERLIAMGKRISNILKQQADTVNNLSAVDYSVLVIESEKNLLLQTKKLQATINVHIENNDFASALSACVPLDKTLASFFAEVMVMDENRPLRFARLALLKQLDTLLNIVGALSEIQINTHSL